MNVLGIDPGYGDTKIVFGNESEIIQMFKFPSVAGPVPKSELVTDHRLLEFGSSSYYIGEDALRLESSKIIDVTDYKNLEKYSPLFIAHALRTISDMPDVVVAGLSIAQVQNSGHYKRNIEEFFVNSLKVTLRGMRIVPQGIGAKIAFDKYGDRFPDTSRDFSDQANYIGCDVGFNTLDVFQVLNGTTTPNLIKGLENKGIIVLVIRLLKHIKDEFQFSYGIKEGKDILDAGRFKRRGKYYNVSEYVNKIKREYLGQLNALVEDQFGKVLDKSDHMIMFGGGSYIFKDMADDFLKIPDKRLEYYNAIGYYLTGVSLSTKI